MSPEHTERRGAHPAFRLLCWFIAPLDSQKSGLSLTRILAVCFFWATVHIAHDWLDRMKVKGDAPGWAFGTFVIAGFAISICTALGGKYVLAFLNSRLNPSNDPPTRRPD